MYILFIDIRDTFVCLDACDLLTHKEQNTILLCQKKEKIKQSNQKSRYKRKVVRKKKRNQTILFSSFLSLSISLSLSLVSFDLLMILFCLIISFSFLLKDETGISARVRSLFFCVFVVVVFDWNFFTLQENMINMRIVDVILLLCVFL